MTNSTRQAFPLPSTDAEIYPGLNKREYFAIMAMQGLIANNPERTHLATACDAIMYADELLRQLEE